MEINYEEIIQNLALKITQLEIDNAVLTSQLNATVKELDESKKEESGDE